MIIHTTIKVTGDSQALADFAAKEGIALDPATSSGPAPATPEAPVKTMGPQTEKN